MPAVPAGLTALPLRSDLTGPSGGRPLLYDAIVVGARCAGAATALLLARKGHRVLLLDRASFPADIPHGHFVHRGGPARLARWGLLDRVLATGCPGMTTYVSDYGDYRMVARDVAAGGVPFACAPRRAALDTVLVQAAVEAGAELRAGFVVEGFTRTGDRITGIRGRARAGGGIWVEHAPITIGADGRSSRLAREVEAPAYEVTAPLSCWYFSYWSGVLADGLEVHALGDRAIFAFPTNHDLFCVMVDWPAAELPHVRADVERQLMAVVDRVPDLSDRVRAGRREERIYGATDLPNFLRRPCGPGWALVGDAGCHKDPFMALGICDAFRDAELLADALDDAFTGRRAFDDAMAHYHRLRDQATLVDYRRNIHFASFQPMPPDFRALRAAVRGDAEAMRRLCLMTEGFLPKEEFLTPEMERRMATAAARLA